MSNVSRFTFTAAVLAVVLALLSLPALSPVSAAQKAGPKKTPALTMKLRERIAASGKTARVATKVPVRVRDAAAKVSSEQRATSFGARAAGTAAKSAAPSASKGAPWIADSPRRASLPAEKGTSFVGRNGTGLGDIFEDEPNDSVAHILDDVPLSLIHI